MADPQLDLKDRLAELLTQGCDDRIVINAKTGMHKYNGTNRPVPGSIRRSSCTFNVPTEDVFQEGMKTLQQLDANPGQTDALRETMVKRLAEIWGAAGTALTMFPSGTDAEFLPMLVALARALRLGGPLASIISCAGEVGSGTSQASVGQHFSPLLPQPEMQEDVHHVGGSIFAEEDRPEIRAIELKLRDAHGKRFPMEELDATVKGSVEKALGDDGNAVVLVHMVVGSKTGHLMPSLECMQALISTYGERVVPLADACQVRMVDEGLQHLVSAGLAVIATGSKFYGGPPFCAAALLPDAMVAELNTALAEGAPGNLCGKIKASSLNAYLDASLVPLELSALKALLRDASPNLGLLMRWCMALCNIENYHAIPEDERHRIENEWMRETQDLIQAKGLETVGLFEDVSSRTASIQRRGTVAFKAESGMLPDATIILLDLKRPETDGSMRRCTLAEMKCIHNLMARDLSGIAGIQEPENAAWAIRCFLAQPVSLCSSVHVLRAAIGAPLTIRLSSGNSDAVRSEDGCWVDKLHLILSSWAALQE